MYGAWITDAVEFSDETSGRLAMVTTSDAIVVSVSFNEYKSDVKLNDEQPSKDTGNVLEGGALAEAPKLIQDAIPIAPMRPKTTP